MTIVKEVSSLKLNMKIQTGVSDTGSPVYCVKSLANVDPDAPVANIFAVGQKIASMYEGNLVALTLTEVYNLRQDAE